MPDFAVNTAFNAKGNILKNVNAMDKGMKRFGDTATKSFRRASQSSNQFGATVKGILAADVVRSGLSSLRSGLVATSQEFISYDKSITAASAKFKGLDLATVEGQKSLESLKNTARDVGANTEFSATQAAQGLDFLAMAGFNADQAMAALPGVVDLATVAQVDLARATDISSDSLGAFGLMTEDATQLQENFTRVNDVFAKTMTTSNTGMEVLFESVTKGAPAFTAAGQSMETFAALTGVMANSGVKGSEAGTSLRNVMLRLSDPAKDAAKIMNSLGVDVQDQAGNFRDVIDVLGDFETGLKGMGDVQRAAALSTVFGARSVSGINILLQEGTDSLRDYREGLLDSAGASRTMADVIRGSIGNQLASLKSAALEVGFQFIDSFQGKIGPAIESVTAAIRGINVPGIIDNFTKLIEVGMRFRGVLIGMATGWALFKVAMTGAAIVQGIQTFMAFTTALRTAAAAQGILNAVMTANPIGLIVTAIAALVGGLILIVDNFDLVKIAFKASMDFLADAALGFFKIMMNPLGALISGIQKISSFFGSDDTNSEKANAQIEARLAPNETTLAAQEVQFNGQLNIAGAPDGSNFENNSPGAPSVDVNLLGLQP